MGNESTKNAMIVACDTVSVPNGGEITGHIYIQLNKSIKKVTKLFLVFTGSEYVEWDSGLLDSCKHKLKFKKENKELYSWSGGLKKGQYDFPFTFRIADNLIPSFSLKEENYQARIDYFIHAALLSKTSKLKNSVNIEILESNPSPRVPVGILKDLNFKSCCRLNTVQLKGQLNSNIYYPDENLTLEFSYSTKNSSSSIGDIEVLLIRKLLLKNSGSSSNYTSKTLFKRSFAPVPSNLAESKPVVSTFKLSKFSEELSKAHKVESKLIKCKYYLVVRQSALGFCKETLPDFESEVVIVSKDTFLKQQDLPVIDDWRPESFPVLRMSFKDFAPSAPDFEE